MYRVSQRHTASEQQNILADMTEPGSCNGMDQESADPALPATSALTEEQRVHTMPCLQTTTTPLELHFLGPI